MIRLLTLALGAALTSATPAAERGRVGFYSLAGVAQTGDPTIGRVAAHASDLARDLLRAQLVPVNAHGASDADIGNACRSGRVNAIFVLFYQDASTVDDSRLHETAESHLDLFDCFGDIAFDGAGTAEAVVSLSSAAEGSYDEARIATDRAFAVLRDRTGVEPSALANLVRYGFPIADGSRTAGLRLRSGPLGAIANPFNFGTAARAGVSRDDVVTALNGESLIGLTGDELHAAVEDAERTGGHYVVDVTGKDGKARTCTFASEDLAGYLRDLAGER